MWHKVYVAMRWVLLGDGSRFLGVTGVTLRFPLLLFLALTSFTLRTSGDSLGKNVILYGLSIHPVATPLAGGSGKGPCRRTVQIKALTLENNSVFIQMSYGTYVALIYIISV